MGDYTSGGLTGVGSTTLPISSLYGPGAAAALARVSRIQIWNTGAAAVSLKLASLTTAGTRGAAMTKYTLTQHNPETSAATAYQTHTVAPTAVDFGGYRVYLPVGGGVIWDFPDWGLVIPATANAGIGILVSTGTGQACEVSWDWRE
jgi:hypothetical protein